MATKIPCTARVGQPVIVNGFVTFCTTWRYNVMAGMQLVYAYPIDLGGKFILVGYYNYSVS